MTTSSGSSGSLVDFGVSEEAFNLSPWSESTESYAPPKISKFTRTLAPNLTRRSHKKSRGGCFNCKSRKIKVSQSRWRSISTTSSADGQKCSETKPSCENCLSRELECSYPSKTDQKIICRPTCPSKPDTAMVKHGEPALPPTLSAPTSFSMDDMRCFHHFLTVAYPHLPLGNDSVWIHDIPVFAQQHKYLMHALLALGASHLTRVSPQTNYNTLAIIHRGRAIQGLNSALANPNRRAYGESDALLAACYALTFQASYMGDGMSDFITMVRGCALVTTQINQDASATAFNLEKDSHLRLMEPRLDHLPTLDPTHLITPALRSVQALRSLLRTTMDAHFHAALLSVLVALQESSRAGYLNFIRVYATFFDMSHDQFGVFVDVHNLPAQLLMAHFIALQMLMVPLTLHEWPERSDVSRATVLLGIVEWADRIFERTPPAMGGYLEWPRGIMGMVRAEIEALQQQEVGNYRALGLRILDP